MNDNEEEYTEERIRDFIVRSRDKSPRVIVDDLLRDVLAFASSVPPQDDTTIVALKMTDGMHLHE
jgi:serine phosphatase RsbU (regulator of sigma subunit)